MSTPRSRGRSQAQRTAATRKALIDATVDSLVHRGFARTTTTIVAQDAQMSLGALSHHFPTKAELMTATVAHLLELRQAEFRDRVAAVAAGHDRVQTAIDALWDVFSGPTFVAWVELWVGGRRDPELAGAVLHMQDEFMRSSRELFDELFPPSECAGTGFDHRSMAFAFAVMEGLALKSIAGDPIDETPIQMLKAMARRAASTDPPRGDSGSIRGGTPRTRTTRIRPSGS